jgi:asparagine synthase (glutamine-hydrolysing)
VCGICGELDLSGEDSVREPVVRRMMAAQRHRGPDDAGCHLEPGVGLGFSRLAILDLSPAGHQPMTNEDGALWLVFNGEIYNFRDLTPALERAGHRFRSRCDSEVILHAYEEWGGACLERLNGMFAFALWDRRRRELLLARDRLGVKPLYYWSDGRTLAFASELKALLAHPDVPRALDRQALVSYLLHEYVPSPRSIFAGIRKLPAGHVLRVPLDGAARGRATEEWRPERYWDVRFGGGENGRTRSDEEYADELRGLLRAAVARRLVSDVPLGAFLSGGLDSSSVVALMAELGGERPRTFAIGFEETSFDELRYAERVAHHFDTDHHVAILRPDAHELIATVAEYLDEPFADASALPTYLVARMAREHVTVALSGDGGDELFAGYDWYGARWMAAASVDRLPDGLRARLGALAARIPPGPAKKGALNVARRFLEGAALPPELQHTRWRTFWSAGELDALLVDDGMLELAGDFAATRALLADSGSRHPLDQQQYADIKDYLPDDILFKVDRMSMAVSLEARGPFLDYTLVEFAARLPPGLRWRGLDSKRLLRLAMRKNLPPDILRRRKLGFNIPYKHWLRGDLRDLMLDALAPARLGQQAIFRPAAVERLVREHLDGTRDHAHKLWQLLMFQLWAERFLVGDRGRDEEPEMRGGMLDGRDTRLRALG